LLLALEEREVNTNPNPSEPAFVSFDISSDPWTGRVLHIIDTFSQVFAGQHESPSPLKVEFNALLCKIGLVVAHPSLSKRQSEPFAKAF
jgi:hypothetical protein